MNTCLVVAYKRTYDAQVRLLDFMVKLTAADLVREIAKLDSTQVYTYFSGRSKMQITDVRHPEGPIGFFSWASNKTPVGGREGSVSVNQLATVALVFSRRPNYPIHFDRLFSAGGNSRSAFETLLAHTPHFFICYPQKINPYTGEPEQDQKHIMWCPGDEHPWGETAVKEYQQVISEIELDVDFGSIGITAAMLGREFDSIEAKRTHTQMQVALVEIGRALNFRTWIAKNDHPILIKDTKLGQLSGVIPSLDDMPIFYKTEIKEAASLIDCIWFTSDGDKVPAVIEVEHSTGVTSGMTRMLKFSKTIPSMTITFVVVAPDNLRNKVVSEANNKTFKSLGVKFMPYSTIRELYGLIHRYSLSNVVDHSFINPFMETIVED